ncbi:MAG: DUF2017 domain-containing protein [Propionibacteriales bacterium]|nr:DUF2017 domain-containing protein [Propionibacteriales bacterium]
MSVFRARRKGRVAVELPPYAAGLLASLVRQLVELLSDGEAAATATDDPLEALLDFDTPREPPEDPALRRLLPDAHPGDPEVAAEFRRFTERGLRESKVASALVVLKTMGLSEDDPDDADLEFELEEDQVRAWMRCLTDLRLTLAERLGVTADDDEFWANLPAGDDRLPIYEIYGWLAYLLESLIDAGKLA